MSRLLTLLCPAGGFTPASLPGLLLWLTAGPTWCFTDTAGTAPAGAGDPVALWKERSGNGYHLSQATGGNRPTLQQDASGKYYVGFGGSAHLHRGTLPQLYAQPNSIGFAFRRSSGTRLFDGFTSGSAGVSRFEPTTSYRLACGTTLAGGATDANDHTMFGLCNGASSSVYADGSPAATGDAGAGGIDALNVGASEAGTSAFNGRAYGGVVTNALLSAAQLAQVQAYLRALMP